MTEFLLIVYLLTLIYVGIAGTLGSFVRILAVQGLLLTGLALTGLHSLSFYNLLFILVETLVFKAIVVPLILRRAMGAQLTSRLGPRLGVSATALLTTMVVVFSFVAVHRLRGEHVSQGLLTAALASSLIGLGIMLNLRRAYAHLTGFLLLENGLFLLALAIGAEMPLAVNSALLLDLFVGVLLMGLLVRRLARLDPEADVTRLTELRD